MSSDRPRAARLATAGGDADAEAVLARARDLGLLGWVRADEDGVVRVHAEGEAGAVERLRESLGPAVEETRAKVEGHEQLARRGVPAGVFVVQEHQATAHHYDLRLEVDGVMRSWAVPKGPSMDPARKRLAVEVADHGMGHNTYEGPTVIVWDRGTYENLREEPMAEALANGRLTFRLEGEKLRGAWSLRRLDGRRWLLVKKADEDADREHDPVSERPESVVTGRTIEEV